MYRIMSACLTRSDYLFFSTLAIRNIVLDQTKPAFFFMKKTLWNYTIPPDILVQQKFTLKFANVPVLVDSVQNLAPSFETY